MGGLCPAGPRGTIEWGQRVWYPDENLCSALVGVAGAGL
jgi:hypothetical protein